MGSYWTDFRPISVLDLVTGPRTLTCHVINYSFVREGGQFTGLGFEFYFFLLNKLHSQSLFSNCNSSPSLTRENIFWCYVQIWEEEIIFICLLK